MLILILCDCKTTLQINSGSEFESYKLIGIPFPLALLVCTLLSVLMYAYLPLPLWSAFCIYTSPELFGKALYLANWFAAVWE